jgi:hypothetical protein
MSPSLCIGRLAILFLLPISVLAAPIQHTPRQLDALKGLLGGIDPLGAVGSAADAAGGLPDAAGGGLDQLTGLTKNLVSHLIQLIDSIYGLKPL